MMKISTGDDIHNKKTEAGASQEKKKFYSGNFAALFAPGNGNCGNPSFPGTYRYKAYGRTKHTGI